MDFKQTLAKHFPNAMPEADFVSRTYQALFEQGFNRPNTIACVSVCRDELTYPLVDKIYHTWGEGFNFSSLAGMLFLGKTGFSAAKNHAPETDGRERYAFLPCPTSPLGLKGKLACAIAQAGARRLTLVGP